MRRRTKTTRLLKKTSPEPPHSSNLHLENLMGSITDDRQAPRESTRMTSLGEIGKTTLLLEIPYSIFLTCHNFCHQSRVAKKTK
jgi:3-dehydroquinate synthetase